MKRRTIIGIAIAAHLVPITAWAMVKPLRIVAPELLGLSCTADNICMDDLSRLPEARALLSSSAAFVQAQLGPISTRPRAIFCSSPECSRKFGLGRSVAFSVGQVGVIFSDHAWEPFYVRHELIHHLQNERLGTINAWLLKPSWFIEGMAYYRSEDPRRPLPEPLEAWRKQYEEWEQNLGSASIWSAAEHVN